MFKLLLRAATNACRNFSITLDQFESIKHATFPPPEAIFENSVINSHKYLSFQDPEKISSALSLIWAETHKWQAIALRLGKSESDVKIELNNIIIRRNQIVHEADIDPMTDQVQQIREMDIEESVNFLNALGNCIDSLI